MKETTVPQSSYPGPYIPALNNLWCHTGNKQPAEEKKGHRRRGYSYRAFCFLYENDAEEHCINSVPLMTWFVIFKPSGFRVFDLVDDAAGEEGGRFLAVCVEVERHQSVGPHGEVVVHGQNLRRRCRVLLGVATQTQSSFTGKGRCHRSNSPLASGSRRLSRPPALSTWERWQRFKTGAKDTKTELKPGFWR